MKTIVIIFTMLLLFLRGAPAQTAETYISQGRAFLAAHDLTNADARFALAVAASPNHATGNVFRAATRLLTLQNRPAAAAFLDRLGLATTGRDLYNWTADFPRDIHGIPLAPTNLSGAELTAFLRTNVLPEIIAADANLAVVTDKNFVLNLTSNETAALAVTLDYGDIALMRAVLKGAQYAAYTIHSWNVDEQLATLRSIVEAGSQTAEEFLRQRPNLFTFATTNDLNAARQAFSDGVTLYMNASGFIRNRPTNVTRLFNLDPEETQSEADFRTTIGDLLQSLNGAVALQLFPEYTVNLSNHFAGRLPPRGWLPQIAGNSIVAGTIPDMTFGGMVGGLFAGLVAPYIFSWIAEYPILLSLAALCRPPGRERLPRFTQWYWPLLAAIAVALILPTYYSGKIFSFLEDNRNWMIGSVGALAALLAVALNGNRWKIFATVAVALVLLRAYPSDDGRVETVRSFFGVHKIVVTPNGQYHVLMHGTTIHGAEKFRNDDGSPVTGRPEPITYYHKDGGIGQAIAAIRERKGAPLKVAVIGLGSGSLTCASEPGEDWKFFEIDQTMVDSARDPKYFTYIQKCEPNLKPVIGDARLTFAREPSGAYDVIIVDAYSSDAIPIHLATEEAMEIYKDKLAPHGAVVMHVSNRHLELESVVVGIADANDLKSWVYSEDTGRDAEYIFSTTVVVSAREEADVGKLASSDKWTLTEAEDHQRVWTDDYSNIVGALWRRLRDGEQ